MQGWRIVVVSVTVSVLFVTLYRLSLTPRRVAIRPYLPLNETSQVHITPAPLDGRLVDLTDFNFLTEHDCNGTSPFLLALVHSAPQNIVNRIAVRKTWGKQVRVLFLVGESDVDLEDEERRYGDLIRGSFRDSYRNLTYKHVMALKWVLSKCPGVKYILKTDDDVFVHSQALKEWLLEVSPHGARNLIACRVESNALVKRSYRSKWRVTPQEYPERYYPDYCHGWVILYSPDVAQALYTESTKTSYFWIDDVLVTGILAKRANLTHLHLGDLAVSDTETTNKIVSGIHTQPFMFLLTTPQMFYTLTQSLRFNYRNIL